jgi:phosphatidate cytidylyltransferase
MLRTRLWMGAVLVALVLGVLLLDNYLAPWYPFLFGVVLLLGLAGCHELLQLLDAARRPAAWLCYAAVTALVLANWLPMTLALVRPQWISAPDPWYWIVGTFAGAIGAAFLVEMATFRTPGNAVPRMALTVWIVGYLGLLPSFLLQLRWLDVRETGRLSSLALALAVFVPKCGDIGAYFTGRFLGRHRMTPILSPKKTWEGAAGGLSAAVLAALAIASMGSVVRGGPVSAAGLGLTLGIAGMLGDLAESLIKRDCERKDASQAVPGFGGVLDVVDSILFAAPVAYWWLQ